MFDWQNCSGYRRCLFEAADFFIVASHFSLRRYEGEHGGIFLTLRVCMRRLVITELVLRDVRSNLLC